MKLKQYIDEGRMSRQELSDKSGVSYQTIKAAARGALISHYETAKAISDATIPTGETEPVVSIKELCE